MAKTLSTMLALGTKLPAFTLPDALGKIYKHTDFAGQPLVVAFICNHCPFVKHISQHLAAFAKAYVPHKVAMVAINANDVEAYPEDAPIYMTRVAHEQGYVFAYLYDATQQVARAFAAACTPDFYFFNAEHVLVYRGQYDDSRPGNNLPVDGKSLQAAIDAYLAGQPIDLQQRPSIGCNIKWKE